MENGSGMTREKVAVILKGLLVEMDTYGAEGKDAEHIASYIAGLTDMACEVMRALDEEDGNEN